MKAIALGTADRPTGVMEIPKPEVGEADVLVAVRAASVKGWMSIRPTASSSG